VAVLLLNASYEPLHTVSMRRAMGLVFAGKAEPVETRDGEVIRSAGGESWPKPVVIRLRYMVKVPYQSRVPLNRRTLAFRDKGACQVVGCARRGTTIDHVVPRSRGGRHEWTNVVLMCHQHNNTKGDRMLSELGWSLRATPSVPKGIVLVDSVDPAWDTWIAPFAGA
jgi:5-methylcytosine-specific restriction endonuclease McrA